MKGELPTILVVDDDPTTVAPFVASLKLHFRVLTALLAAEALKVLSREEVAVLLTDVDMPQMSGLELVAEVKRRHPGVVARPSRAAKFTLPENAPYSLRLAVHDHSRRRAGGRGSLG